MVAPADLYPPERLVAAQQATAAAGLDALLLTPGADLRYLTGYHAKPLERLTCLVLPASGDPLLIVPLLERPAAEASPAGRLDLEIAAWPETEDPYHLVTRRLGQARSVGVADRMWAEQVLAFRHALPRAEQRLAGDVLRPMRLRKSAAEIAALREAGAAIDAVHARMGEWLRPGRSERAVAGDIADAILGSGHERVNFVIVGSGPNGASPHHDAGERLIESGDVVVVDIGGTTPEGYCSDCTRTYVAGTEPDPEARRYYEVLRDAQAAAVAAVRPGITAAEVDARARDLIADGGYGEFFVHRTGHGIGLEEHEDPYVVAGNDTRLEPGMCFSIEPGIYLPGRHGARIEDIVVVTDTGVEALNHVEHDLAVLAA